MLFLLADSSGDLTCRRTPESMIEASKGNAKFVALEVEWVATGETNVPEWLSEHRPEGQNDRSAIQGTWQVTYSEDSGRIAPQKMLENLRFVIDDQTLTTEIAGRKSVSKYQLDPMSSPKSIDLTENGHTKLGIYDLVGDTLRICIAESGSRRPTAFDSQPDSANDVIIMLKRIGP